MTQTMTKKTHQLSSIEQDILSNIKSGSAITDAFAPLMKRVMEAALQGEIDNGTVVNLVF